jgi:hypothetical protein
VLNDPSEFNLPPCYDPANSMRIPSLLRLSLIREDKKKRREGDLIHALQTNQLVITPEELTGRNLVAVLREKLSIRSF